jgi:hypothetical protein
MSRCRHRGCKRTVVGSSITGKGHVCKPHNELEWGQALKRSRDPDHRTMAIGLLADAASQLDATMVRP